MTAVRIVALGVGAGIAVFFSFLGVILDDRGFDPAAIGLTIALASLTFTLAVPVWGHLADVRLGRPRALAICAIGAALAILPLLAALPALAVVACVVVFAAFESAWQSLTDAVTINALGDRRREYGRVRMLTSFSFAAAAILAGQLYDVAGYGPAPIVFAACAIAIAIGTLGVPDVERADLASHDGIVGPGRRPRHTWRFGSTGVALRVAPQLAIVMLAVLLAHVGIMGGFTFLPLRIVELGGSPADVALMSGLSAAVEIPGMLLAAGIARRVGLRAVFVGSAVLYGMMIASWTQLATPEALIIARGVTGIAWAGLVVSVVLTIGALLPPTLQATGQALYQTIAFGVSAVIANLIGGLIYGSLGHAAFFAVGAVCTLAAAVVGLVAIPARSEAAPEVAPARVG